jgi:signal transduction histidine kinase
MPKLRLRTKFLVSLILLAFALTLASLIIVRRMVNTQVRAQATRDLSNSVATFRNVQREREQALTRSARLVADLPIVRALMTTEHTATIQDVSRDLWRLGGGDLFVLVDRDGRVVATHTNSEFDHDVAQEVFQRTSPQGHSIQWWFGSNHLYEVAIEPIYFGEERRQQLLGFLIVGFEIDDRVTHELSQVAASEVAFYYGDALVRSTLSAEQRRIFSGQGTRVSGASLESPLEIQLGGERFLGATIGLPPSTAGPVRLTLLKSLDQSSLFLHRLNRLLMLLGVLAAAGGCIWVYVISHRFTRPLGDLVGGVRALEAGDFNYPLRPTGSDEVAELTKAFGVMRGTLEKSQRDLLDAERMATIGRMANSISHDLRHQLSAILANAEFLSDQHRDGTEREELYQELRFAVYQMNDLIESLLEFSRTRESLRLRPGKLEDAVKAAIQNVRMHPEFSRIAIDLHAEGCTEGQFDMKKLERVFQNLLFNACQAIGMNDGKISIEIKEPNAGGFEVIITDTGGGIPAALQERIFEPFFSHGKENGTGLGLTVSQKIIQDHGGELRLAKTSNAGAVFVVHLPYTPQLSRSQVEATSAVHQ